MHFVTNEYLLIGGLKHPGENAQDVRFRNYGAWMRLNSDPEAAKTYSTD